LGQGADGIEFDLRLSRDGEIVVFHDPNLHRVAGAAYRVDELTAHELAEYPLRYGGKIPTLNEVTAQIHAPVWLDMEVKHRDVWQVLAKKLRTSAALRQRAIISSFNPRIIRAVREEFPEMRTIMLNRRWPLPLRGRKFWATVDALRPWAVGFPIMVNNRRRVRHLKRLGYKVAGWDLRNSRSERLKAESLGLDVAIVKWIRLEDAKADPKRIRKFIDYVRRK
jgi:glycerophosphoryl diester phosphodiesterase